MMLNSNAEPYNCPVCNQSYRTKKCLQRHLKKHFDDNSYVCQLCASSFSSRAELVIHRRTHREGKLYKCSECVRSFHRRDSLMRHVNVHWHLELKCDLCDKTFKSENSLNIHHRIHIGDKPYQCDLCDSAFVCKEYLRGHRKKVHNVKNVLYQCDICKKIFKSSVGLRLHKISHSTDRPHICHLCPETFKYKGNLNEHLRRHICPKPFICPICSKAFSSWAGVYEHKRTHSSIREFQCETCGKSYRRKAHLVRHNVSHGDEKAFACKYCGKRFKYRRAMNVHIRSHTGHRPYTCDLCGHQFAQKSRMKSHRMTHTGEKPYRCIACNKAFCRHDKLTDHCRRMHKQLIDLNKSLSSPFELRECKTGNDELDANNTKNKPEVADAKNNSDRNSNQITEIHTPVSKMNTSAGRYVTRSKRNHENGDIVIDDVAGGTSNSRRKSTVVITNGEEDCNMSLKIEVFDETELTDDFYLDNNSKEFLTDVREAGQERDFRQCVKGPTASIKTAWPRFLTRERTNSREEVEKLIEQNNDESNNSVGGNSEVMDSDEVAEVTDSDDVTVHYLEDEEENAGEDATDDIPAADAESSLVFRTVDHISKEGICFWSDNDSIQNDEDFLFAMRVFQLLKSHPPGVQKNSLKAQVEDMLLDANKASLI